MTRPVKRLADSIVTLDQWRRRRAMRELVEGGVPRRLRSARHRGPGRSPPAPWRSPVPGSPSTERNKLRRLALVFPRGRNMREAGRQWHGQPTLASAVAGRSGFPPPFVMRGGDESRCSPDRRLDACNGGTRPASRSSQADTQGGRARTPGRRRLCTDRASASIPPGATWRGQRSAPGDVALVNGMLGDQRGRRSWRPRRLALTPTIRSDCRPLTALMGRRVHWPLRQGTRAARDANRGAAWSARG